MAAETQQQVRHCTVQLLFSCICLCVNVLGPDVASGCCVLCPGMFSCQLNMAGMVIDVNTETDSLHAWHSNCVELMEQMLITSFCSGTPYLLM